MTDDGVHPVDPLKPVAHSSDARPFTRVEVTSALMKAAAALKDGRRGLSDGSQRGDWRLPTNAEWREMVDAAANHPMLRCTNPTLTDDSASVCFGSGGGSSFANYVTSSRVLVEHNQFPVRRPPTQRNLGRQYESGEWIFGWPLSQGLLPSQLAWPVRAS